jgi:hypothetical protein
LGKEATAYPNKKMEEERRRNLEEGESWVVCLLLAADLLLRT